MRVITEKYILVQRYADNGQEDHLSLFNTQTGMFVLENIEEYEEAQQQFQPDNGGECTRPDIVGCHAKGGTGGRCMNGVRCPPLQVK